VRTPEPSTQSVSRPWASSSVAIAEQAAVRISVTTPPSMIAVGWPVSGENLAKKGTHVA
jgi:hypothetical protein